MFSLADKGTPPDHDTWLSRTPPPPMRKRSIAQISDPVITPHLQNPTAALAPHHRPCTLGTAQPTVAHSHPPAGSRVTWSTPDLEHPCMSEKAFGKQRCDPTPPVASLTSTRARPNHHTVDAQQELDHADNLPASLASCSRLYREPTDHAHDQRDLLKVQETQVREQRRLLAARAGDEHRQLFDHDSTGNHDCFYAIAAKFQTDRGKKTSPHQMRQSLGTWYSDHQNKALVSAKMTEPMTTQASWDTRICQTQTQGHQADDTDVHAMALMLQIHIRILSSVNTQDLVFIAFSC